MINASRLCFALVVLVGVSVAPCAFAQEVVIPAIDGQQMAADVESIRQLAESEVQKQMAAVGQSDNVPAESKAELQQKTEMMKQFDSHLEEEKSRLVKEAQQRQEEVVAAIQKKQEQAPNQDVTVNLQGILQEGQENKACAGYSCIMNNTQWK
jgi:vacuolar-type H+-ATPase subunit I/STV1